MNTEITSNIHYVGVNDRHKNLFEGLWPLPYGVSYNSYIIDDEKVALIDTVEADFFGQFLDNVRSVIGDRQIDYVIVNHVEPDHSGSLALIKKYYPGARIVGNKKTFDMVRGFYHVGESVDEIVEVKNGDTLSLGKHRLSFTMIPMVHWPETMVTLDETAHALFSGDAFGCFGALSGAFVDSDMNCDVFWGEMQRYYSNIVGKYGVPVQQALKKLAGVQIDYICSTHGPVWHDNISRVIAEYDRMSRYATAPGLVVCYGSMYGNTERAAEVIARAASQAGVKDIVMHDVSRSSPARRVPLPRTHCRRAYLQQRPLSADGDAHVGTCRAWRQEPSARCVRLVHMGRAGREEDTGVERHEAEVPACRPTGRDKAESHCRDGSRLRDSWPRHGRGAACRIGCVDAKKRPPDSGESRRSIKR